jgi:condensin complex subunit 1
MCFHLMLQLLASSMPTDVTEAISLVVLANQFNIDGAAAAVQRMLALIFSRDTAVRDAVVDAAVTLYLHKAEADRPRVAAKRLIAAASGASLGTLAALEELVGQLVTKELLPPKGAVVRALWAMVGVTNPIPHNRPTS